MAKLCVCLETVFPNLPIEKRIEPVARAGYRFVEVWFMGCSWEKEDMAVTAKKLKDFARACADNGVTFNNLVLNGPSGSPGGALVRPSDHAVYLERLKRVAGAALSAGCSMAITCTGNWQYKRSREDQRRSIVDVLRKAATIAEPLGFSLVLEALNTYTDHAGYFLDSPEEGASIVREVNSPRVKLLYDVYHMQIMSGNHTNFIRQNLDIIGHFHSAGVPGRHELFDGEIAYPFIMKELDRLDYGGCFGLEYTPALKDHAESLAKVKQYLETR